MVQNSCHESAFRLRASLQTPFLHLAARPFSKLEPCFPLSLLRLTSLSPSTRQLQLSMDVQQDQQPTSSAAARPQQPADSLAASLPTETLAQILEASLERLDVWERQKAGMSFAQVCVRWHGAVGFGKELAVKDATIAERLAKQLKAGDCLTTERVRTLSVRIEADGGGRSQRAARLLTVCPRLISLELKAKGRLSLGVGWDPDLGQPLMKALKGHTQLQEFSFVGSDNLTVMPARAMLE